MSRHEHIAVLMGGWSAEREISLLSGQNCARALRNAGFTVTEVDVSEDLPQVLKALAPDVAFNALHGVGGEDGVVQDMLEALNIPYTHSGVQSSALAMDKVRAKEVFARHGLPVAADRVLEKTDYADHPMPPPYVIKPVSEGSSVGIHLVGQNDPVPACLSLDGWAFEGAVMAEAYVSGREFTCAVMGDRPLEVMEIRPKAKFYDYQAKYTEGGSDHIVPAPIGRELRDTIREMAVTAHQVLGCRGVTRTDFIHDENGAGLTVLELNTQPGMTNLSLVPEMAAHDGVSYEDLVTWMVEDASCQR
ncbi:MAG: D-alanine--D-alanine ligase [Parvibaculales bacterium]